MRLPHQPVFAAQHVQLFRRRADVVDLPMLRVVLGELLPIRSHVRPVDRMRQERYVVATQRRLGLLARHQQESTAGEEGGARAIGLLLSEAKRAGIVGMRITMKIREDRDIDAEPPEYLQPAWLQIQSPGVGKLLVEVHMKMAHEHLVTRQRLIMVVVRERQNGLLRCAAVLRAEVEVDRHALPRSGRRVVQREIEDVVPRFLRAPVPHLVGNAVWTKGLFALRLTNAAGERILSVLAIVDKAKIGFDFACEEKLVRRWENGQRSAGGFHDLQPVASLHCNRLAVDAAAESVLLPFTCYVAPD